MEEKIYYTNLFDTYGSLLTEKQQSCFKEYYFEDLSEAEISENEAVSKNAVSKHIKQAKKMLDYYEKELRMCECAKSLKREFANEPELLSRIASCGINI